MRKRKQPCRHYCRFRLAEHSVTRGLNAISLPKDCAVCAHWKWQTHPYKTDICRRTNTDCPKRYTCRHFRGAWAQMRKEAK